MPAVVVPVADLLRGFIAIHFRHLAIHQHGIVGGAGNGIHSSPRSVPPPLTSKLLQNLHRTTGLFIVVYDKNPERCVRSAINATDDFIASAEVVR